MCLVSLIYYIHIPNEQTSMYLHADIHMYGERLSSKGLATRDGMCKYLSA